MQAAVEQFGRADERIAVHDAVSGELRMLEAGNHAKDPSLLGKRQVRLEPHQVVRRSIGVFRTQLHGRPRPFARGGIGQTHRLARSEAGSVAAFAGDFFDRLARLEQIARLEFLFDDALGGHELVDERLVALLGKRGVQIIAHRLLFVAGLAEQHGFVERVGHDDRSGRIEEGQVVGACPVGDPRRQRIGGQRAGGQNDRIGVDGRTQDLPYDVFDERMLAHQTRDACGKRIAIDRKGAARVDAMLVGLGDQKRAEGRKLRLQHAGRAFRLGAFQRVRADELGAI